MAERIEIVISGDAKSLITELKKAGVQVKEFGEGAQKSGKGAASFADEAKGLAKELGLTFALGATVQQLGQFTVGSFKAAAAAERLGRATDNLAQAMGSSADEMIGGIVAASGQTISQMAAMEAANKAMMFGIVNSKEQMADLTQIAVTLGAAMGQDATKSLDDLTVALGRQSPMILDNLGITLKLEEAYQIYANSLGKSVEQLTEQEKKQAFLNAALEKGREKVAELGGVTVDSAAQVEQLSAAWSDFQVAFGGLLTTMSGGIDTVTSFVRRMEEGANSWKWIIETAGALNEENDSLVGTAAAIRSVDEATGGWLGTLNPLAGAYSNAAGFLVQYTAATADNTQAITENTQATVEAASEQSRAAESARLAGMAQAEQENRQRALSAETERWKALGDANVQTLDALAQGHLMTAREAENYAEAQRKAAEAEQARQEMMSGLATGMASYFLSLNDLEQKSLTDSASFSSQMQGLRNEANTKLKDEETALTDQLAQIEQERAEKIAWVQTGAHARTAEENEAALAHWNAHYDTLKTDAITKNQEITAGIEQELSARQQQAAAAREQERAEYEAHLEDLKLKTALAMLETSGQLQQFTGGLAVSASEAVELIKAGVIPVSDELGSAIQGVLGNLGTASAEAATTAEQNQATLKRAFEGSLPALEDQAGAMKTDLVQASDTAGLAISQFATTTKEQFGIVKESASSMVIEMQATFNDADWEETGKNIDEGLRKGIDENREIVFEAIKGMAKTAVKQAAEELGIHSPSTEGYYLGEMFDQGFANAIDDGKSMVANAGREMVGALTFSVNSAAPGFHKALLDAMKVKTRLTMGGLTGDDFQKKAKAFIGTLLDSRGVVNALEQGALSAGYLRNEAIKLAKELNYPPSMVDSLLNFDAVANDLIGTFEELKAAQEAAYNVSLVGLGSQLAGFSQTAFNQLMTPVSKAVADLEAQFEAAGGQDIFFDDSLTTVAALADEMDELQRKQNAMAVAGQDLSSEEERRLETLRALLAGSEDYFTLQQQLTAEQQKQAKLEEERAALAEKQAQLQFVQQQLQLVQTLKDYGIDPGKIFTQGLGSNIDPQSLITATSAAIDAILGKANGTLANQPGFASGTPPGGFLVPGAMGQPYPITVHGGERVFVDNGRGQAGGEVHYHLHVNSQMPSAGIIQDFRMMASQAGG